MTFSLHLRQRPRHRCRFDAAALVLVGPIGPTNRSPEATITATAAISAACVNRASRGSANKPTVPITTIAPTMRMSQKKQEAPGRTPGQFALTPLSPLLVQREPVIVRGNLLLAFERDPCGTFLQRRYPCVDYRACLAVRIAAPLVRDDLSGVQMTCPCS